jgi:uncharacterized protein (DUF433 family)
VSGASQATRMPSPGVQRSVREAQRRLTSPRPELGGPASSSRVAPVGSSSWKESQTPAPERAATRAVGRTRGGAGGQSGTSHPGFLGIRVLDSTGRGCHHSAMSAQIARVEVNARVMLGKPVIRGTRITVELILRKLSEGATTDDLLDAYPRLTVDDLRAAMAYAADTLAHQETISLSDRREASASH